MIIRTTNSTFYKNVQDKKQDNMTMTMYNVQLPEQLWFNTFFGGEGPKFFHKKGADFMYNVNDVSNLNE